MLNINTERQSILEDFPQISFTLESIKMLTRVLFTWVSKHQNQHAHNVQSQESKILKQANENLNQLKYGKSSGDQVVIGFSFASDWLTEWTNHRVK